MLNFRRKTEAQWSQIKINSYLYGFQIQPGTRWLPGLTETLIREYETRLGFTFPDDVRTFLRHANGTDLPTLDVHGNCGEAYCPGTGVYSYPRDIRQVLGRIKIATDSRPEIALVLKDNGFDLPDDANLLPIYAHRYVVCGPDPEMSAVVSIMETDAIVYGDDLSDYLQAEFLHRNQ